MAWKIFYSILFESFIFPHCKKFWRRAGKGVWGGGDQPQGCIRRGGGGGGGGLEGGGGRGGLAGTPLLLGCPAKNWENLFFSAEDGNGTQKNENLWDIITSKRMPPVGFEPAACKPAAHRSTTHLSHRTAYLMHPKVHSMTCYPKKNSQKFCIGC